MWLPLFFFNTLLLSEVLLGKIKCEALNKELCSIWAAAILHRLFFHQTKNQISVEILSPKSARKHPKPSPLESYVR